jgi:hypothetical protein
MAWLTHEVQRGTEPVAADQAHVAILEGQKMRVRLGGEGWPATGTLDVPAAGGWMVGTARLLSEAAGEEQQREYSVANHRQLDGL